MYICTSTRYLVKCFDANETIQLKALVQILLFCDRLKIWWLLECWQPHHAFSAALQPSLLSLSSDVDELQFNYNSIPIKNAHWHQNLVASFGCLACVVVLCTDTTPYPDRLRKAVLHQHPTIKTSPTAALRSIASSPPILRSAVRTACNRQQ